MKPGMSKLSRTLFRKACALALTSLETGLLAANVQTVSDIYGRPVSALSGEQITLDGRPLYLRF